MKRAYYSESIGGFLDSGPDRILGKLSLHAEFALEHTQKDAWVEQIVILKDALAGFDGKIYFEYSIPRMGRRINAV